MKADPRPSSLTLPIACRDHLQGLVSAPLQLVEYGDYECPFCGAVYPIVKAVQEQMGASLCFAFRNFPLNNMHPHAMHAAEAAEAAGAQNHFWAMHDTLFENQEQLEDADLADYAKALKLDVHRLMGDVLSGAYAARVREDFLSGARGGVNGTPSFFINGAHYSGLPTADGLMLALNRHLFGR